MNLTIIVGRKHQVSAGEMLYSTAYNRWNEEARSSLFPTLVYAPSYLSAQASAICKVGSPVAIGILEQARKHGSLALFRTSGSADKVLYHSGGRYFRKCIRQQLSNEYKELKVQEGFGNSVICLLSSSFYYWFWICISDCYHVTKRDIDALPVPGSLAKATATNDLAERLLKDLWKNAEKRMRNRADGTQREEVNFHVGASRPILNEIDTLVAEHYGFSEEQLDYILSYDFKHRFGSDAAGGDE